MKAPSVALTDPGRGSAIFDTLDELTARDNRVCDAADQAADGDDWAADLWWLR